MFVIISYSHTVFAQQESESSTRTSAKIQGIVINADDMDRDSEKETVDLYGNVQIVYNGQHIKADRARASLRSKQIELYGNVEVSSPKSKIVGEEVKLDYESNTGLIYNGYVQSGTVTFQGRLLQKLAEDEYFVVDADYTTCTNCPASWSFTGSTIRAELGGYAYIKNSVMHFGSVPVFWFPYLVVPLKSDRQSGLLTPSFENSNSGGLTFSQPYFWAISRSTDATFTLKTYELRGQKLLGEYRYVLSPESSGELNFAGIKDQVFKDESRVKNFRSAENKGKLMDRWFLRYQHYHELPDGYVQRSKVNLASDLQYSKDFPLETLNFGDSAMENRFSLTKNTKNQHWSAAGDYYINMMKSDPLAGNEDAVHRLPELRFSQTPQNIADSEWMYSVDLDYVNFTRAGPAYDQMVGPTTINGSTIRYVGNTCNDPNYDQSPNCKRLYTRGYDSTTDLIRTGQRLDFQPTIYRSYSVMNGIDITPKVSYRETNYQFNVGTDNTNVRRYFRTELNNRMTFSGVYGDLKDPKSSRYKHEIIPEVTYTAIPWLDHKTHAFFGNSQQTETPFTSRDNIGDGDLGTNYGLQFDYYDRVFDRNLVTFSVTNRIIEKRWIGDRPSYRQIMAFKLAQSYDAYQATAGGSNKQAWSDLAASLTISLDHFQTNSTFNYFPQQNVTNISSRARITNDDGKFFQAGLTKQYPIVPGQDTDSTKRVEDYTLSSGFISSYLNLMGRVVYNANSANAGNNKIKSWAYIAQFKPPGDCWYITFIQDHVTGGDTNLKLGFEFTFDGVPKAPLPPETLDSFGF